MFFSTDQAIAKEPKNLDKVKAKLIRYHDSGEYQKDQARVTNRALLYLKNRLDGDDAEQKIAIVLDIDETALSNYPTLRALNFGGTKTDTSQALTKADNPAIQPTLELYRYAKDKKIAIFFVTSRPETLKDITIQNLTNAGYQNWDGLIMRPDDYHEKSMSTYKIASRKQIEDQGYEIILNVGDQESDIVGEHADRSFKLPNPYYIIP